MIFKNSLISGVFAVLLLLSVSGCNNLPSTSGAETPVASESAPVESENAPVEESEESMSAEQEVGFVTDVVGNISFTYRDDLQVKEIEGVKYIYYNDTSFYFVESGPLTSIEALDMASAEEFFTAAVQSFNEGDWSNGTIITEINQGNFNGLDVWICEIEMDHVSGAKFSNSTAVLYLDGMLTSFSLISDIDSYQTFAVEFAETIKSISAA